MNLNRYVHCHTYFMYIVINISCRKNESIHKITENKQKCNKRIIRQRTPICGKCKLHKRHRHISGFQFLILDLKVLMFSESFIFCGSRSHFCRLKHNCLRSIMDSFDIPYFKAGGICSAICHVSFPENVIHNVGGNSMLYLILFCSQYLKVFVMNT